MPSNFSVDDFSFLCVWRARRTLLYDCMDDTCRPACSHLADVVTDPAEALYRDAHAAAHVP